MHVYYPKTYQVPNKISKVIGSDSKQNAYIKSYSLIKTKVFSRYKSDFIVTAKGATI